MFRCFPLLAIYYVSVPAEGDFLRPLMLRLLLFFVLIYADKFAIISGLLLAV